MKKRGISFSTLHRQAFISRLEELAGKGISARETARIVGKSYNTVLGFAKKYGIKFIHYNRRSRKKAEEYEMVRYLAEKYTYDSIGKLLKVSRQRIHQICTQERYSNAIEDRKKNDGC